MTKEITIEQEKKAVKTIQKWAGAGEDAYKTVQKIESAKLHGEPIELTKKDKQNLLRGALKAFFDGDISPKTRKLLAANNLDPDNLRKSLIEETIPQTLANIISEGDIERLIALGDLAGEKPDQDIPQGAKRVIRERVIIDLSDGEYNETVS